MQGIVAVIILIILSVVLNTRVCALVEACIHALVARIHIHAPVIARWIYVVWHMCPGRAHVGDFGGS